MRWSTSARVRAAPGFIEPLVRKTAAGVRIYTRRGADWTRRFPRIVAAVERLKAKTVLIDGEAIIARSDGLADFELLHSRTRDELVSLCAFDLLELNGVEVKSFPLSQRKQWLKRLLGRGAGAIAFNQHFEGDGAEIFARACELGCEGIVAKRLDLAYESGRSRSWLKIKNPEAPAARRAEGGTF